MINRFKVSFLPDSATIATNGARHVDQYVERLLSPSEEYKGVAFGSMEGDRAFGLTIIDGDIHAHFTFSLGDSSEREKRVRMFFQDLGQEPCREYLVGGPDAENATKNMSFRLGVDRSEVAMMIQRILVELCGIQPSEGLQFALSRK